MISDDEFRHLRECGAAWCTEADLARLLNKVDEAETKLAKARAALEFYAEGHIDAWGNPSEHGYRALCPRCEDNGDRAHQTLKEIADD